jgi:hypothetical protein
VKFCIVSGEVMLGGNDEQQRSFGVSEHQVRVRLGAPAKNNPRHMPV